MWLKKKPDVEFGPVKLNKGDLKEFLSKISRLSLIVLITGKRGSGKSSLGFSLLQLVNQSTRRKTYVLGYDKLRLPRFIKKTEGLESVPNNACCLIDEGAIVFSSRDSMRSTNKYLSSIMAIARHKNLTLFLIVQNSAMIDVNVLRLTDIVLMKEPSLLQTRFERKGIKEMYEKVTDVFKSYKNKTHLFYAFDDDFEGLISYSLPYFWSDKISKGFNRVKLK